MQEALLLAAKAAELDEVPIGAVIVKDERIIARGHNACIMNHDPTSHAEIVAMRKAGIVLKNYRLIDTTLYTTLEPCVMCASAMVHARIKRVVFAAFDPKQGACGSCFQLANSDTLNHRIDIDSGVLEQQSRQLLQRFFKARR